MSPVKTQFSGVELFIGDSIQFTKDLCAFKLETQVFLVPCQIEMSPSFDPAQINLLKK
jgi:hypothetical protein